MAEQSTGSTFITNRTGKGCKVKLHVLISIFACTNVHVPVHISNYLYCSTCMYMHLITVHACIYNIHIHILGLGYT